MMRQFSLVLLVTAVILSGCTTNQTSRVYSSDQAQRVQTVQEGTIVALAPVTIEDSQNMVGTIAGSVIGGIAGGQVGGGSGSNIATVGGAVLGGVLGNAAEKGIKRKTGFNITVRLTNGQMISVVQEEDPAVTFQTGSRVLIYTQRGASRVVPF